MIAMLLHKYYVRVIPYLDAHNNLCVDKGYLVYAETEQEAIELYLKDRKPPLTATERDLLKATLI